MLIDNLKAYCYSIEEYYCLDELEQIREQVDISLSDIHYYAGMGYIDKATKDLSVLVTLINASVEFELIIDYSIDPSGCCVELNNGKVMYI